MAPPNLPDLTTPVRDLARPDAVRLLRTETIADSLARLRRESIGERVVYFYVTDRDGVLVGVVPTRRLLLSHPGALVGDVMIHPVVSARESESFQQALQLLTERKLLALPVVDESGRLTGVLDLARFTETLVDLERREAAEELFQLAGIHIERGRRRSFTGAVKDRFPWLLANIVSGLIAAYISNSFDYLLRSVVALAFFVPMLLTISESVAMQSATMSLNQFQAAGQRAGIAGAFREMRLGVALGIGSGALVGLIAIVWLRLHSVAVIVSGGIVFAAAIGATLGFFVPRLVRFWKLNPLIASGPVTLALTDVLALSAYFLLSAAVLA